MRWTENILTRLQRLLEGRTQPESPGDPTESIAETAAPASSQPDEIVAVADASSEAVAEPESVALPVAVEQPISEPVDGVSEVADEPAADGPIAAPGVAKGTLVLRLETERGPAPLFEVSRSGATLGRGQDNTIRLEDLSVSRKHARIRYRQGGFWVSDVGSISGTWIDGTRLNAPRRVAAGQVIDIGVCRLTVTAVGEAKEVAIER